MLPRMGNVNITCSDLCAKSPSSAVRRMFLLTCNLYASLASGLKRSFGEWWNQKEGKWGCGMANRCLIGHRESGRKDSLTTGPAVWA